MKCVKVSGKDIAPTLSILREKECIDYTYVQKKEKDTLYIPIVDGVTVDSSLEIVEVDLQKKETKKNFKDEVEKILTEDETPLLKTAYDLLGTIAILEIDEPLWPKAKKIAEILLVCNKTITTVVRKAGKHDGTLRIQKYEHLAGKETMETWHRENGVSLLLKIDEVYYSPRSSTERKRILEQVKPFEDILVMFAGCGPFTCVIAKKSEANHVTAIELNEEGVAYADKSILKNKITNVTNMLGDVRNICPSMQTEGTKFDRIIMPLPKTADEFLPEALMVSKPGTIIHLYDFIDEREFPKIVIDKIKKYLPEEKFEFLEGVKCGQFSPHVFRVCVDFKVL
jgi:tRNA (guanine37-N1)-methyltransferase